MERKEALVKKIVNAMAAVAPLAGIAQGANVAPDAMTPLPPPVVRVADLRADEKPVEVASAEKEVEANAFFRRLRTSFVFTNPNGRVMQGDFEFPIPDGAFVCGYALEVRGEMIPGVVCEKEKARVAFENEVRKGVDPGLVEQVKGNVWRTRIFPLEPKRPRRAEVEYVVMAADAPAGAGPVYERDGDDVFEALPASAQPAPAVKPGSFASGWVFWDASLSRLGKCGADAERLKELLPEKGDWKLVTFSNRPAAPVAATSRDELLKLVGDAVCDGGTSIAAALALAPAAAPKLLFTDEVDTLGGGADWEATPNLVVASRPPAPQRAVEVRRLSADEAAKVKDAKESTLLATVWAARRMSDLAVQADARKDEFLALGRKYGVAGPGLSLIVLENLQQYLDHKIEPHKSLSFHDEWVKRRAAEDDPIAEKKAKADFEARLLQYWEERVKWWKDPIPRRPKPSSGLFGERQVARAFSAAPAAAERDDRALAAEADALMDGDAEASPPAAVAGMAARSPVPMGAVKNDANSPAAVDAGAASVTLKPWDPKTPYVKELDDAKDAYAAYLKQRESYRDSPAFYLDCAGWFFKKGDGETALRVISNLAEFKLEDAVLWRSMGWRLREAGRLDEAVAAFRKALELRGEEAQSHRDLALVLSERGRERGSKADLEEALKLFHEAAFQPYARRSGRRGNDMQVAVVALEELNGLIGWCAANKAKVGEVSVPGFDPAYRRDLPVKLRIVMSWDADETDVDIHVLEPSGDEAYYANRRTPKGGFVGEDVTTGYGPEEYLRKDADAGVYKVLAHYFSSHQTSLTGAVTVQVSVYTDWAQAGEKMQILTLRLDKPKDKFLIGEIKVQ